MKRFITYVFEYDNGVKGRNIGFIKADIRGNDCRMEIHLHNWNRCQGKCMVYLLMDNPESIGIPIGEMVLSQGHGDYRQVFRIHPVVNTGYDFSQIIGAAVRCKNQNYAASFWKDTTDENMRKGRFHIWSEEVSEIQERTENPEPQKTIQEVKVEPVITKVEEEIAEIPEEEEQKTLSAMQEEEKNPYEMPETVETSAEILKEEEIPSEVPEEEENLPTRQSMQAQASNNLQRQNLLRGKASFRRINLSDIKSLPRRNWYLCNNSFLLHGFLNYHYLILKKVEKQGKAKYYLGVPGIYERPERVMALLFGFSEFEAAPKEGGNPNFGYWLCLLDM